MSEKSDTIEALQRFVDRRQPQQAVVCTVDSVDMTELTCYCIPVNGNADIFGARLMAIASIGFTIIPKEQSFVVVDFIDDENGYVTMFSEVDSILLNGDAYGGLVKIADLVTKLRNLENIVNDLVSKYNTHTHVYSPGPLTPAPTAPTTAVETTVLTPTVQADLENITVKHGDGS